MPTIKDLTGQTFGCLWVISIAPRLGPHSTRWNCRCSCGEIITVDRCNLVRGQRACRKCSRETHGMSKTAIYYRWMRMRRRCDDKNSRDYKYYGGRGIRVCYRWESFENFILDMGHPPTKKHSLDRRNHNGNYEPGNVYWATSKEQANNKRNSKLLTVNGKTQTEAQWAREVGIDQRTINKRLSKGWTPEQAILIQPVKRGPLR